MPDEIIGTFPYRDDRQRATVIVSIADIVWNGTDDARVVIDQFRRQSIETSQQVFLRSVHAARDADT